jgi:hypothetical protein
MAADLGATVSQGQSVGPDEPVVLPETINAIEVRQVSEESQGDKSSGITGDEEIGNATSGKRKKNRQRAPSSSSDTSDDLAEDYKVSVPKPQHAGVVFKPVAGPVFSPTGTDGKNPDKKWGSTWLRRLLGLTV